MGEPKPRRLYEPQVYITHGDPVGESLRQREKEARDWADDHMNDRFNEPWEQYHDDKK